MIAAPFADKIGPREPTMSRALQLLDEREGQIIVETGCARFDDEWAGDGMSTVIFGTWAKEHGAVVFSVDVDPVNVHNATNLTAHLPVTVVHDDSVHYLSEFKRPIDLLYLDSMDYPLADLVNLYGTLDKFPETVRLLKHLGDEYLVGHHGEVIEDSQNHARKEIETALPLLHDRSIVLIDDANLPGGGKARLARKVLVREGWECLMDEYQTLWVKP